MVLGVAESCVLVLFSQRSPTSTFTSLRLLLDSFVRLRVPLLSLESAMASAILIFLHEFPLKKRAADGARLHRGERS